MSNDFVGMGGALIVCLIAQSIVFIALAIMAGVISLVGRLAGDKNGTPEAQPMPARSSAPAETDDSEIAAVVMGALSAELNTVNGPVQSAAAQGSAWRLVSLQEAAKGRIRK
jgi:Na+-transporting methylmalonyl-CoA/oxaloacetate decarboxylase gamma subunit